ncbi:YrhC family protein [Litchfieldia salsa]|uniref:YrhC-like protein n=1 Tax=Litchfieldia salsa TaxID=930152 RepID=A0A1H0V8M1_9BACI|nr:YrhC family protein [Litchfieldia salsa]SDP74436.1 YrhC-like protein [Litchfieldia salsa]
MDLEKVKVIQHKITDYKRYSFILIAVSVFLYIGVLIPNEGKTNLQMIALMGTTVLFLITSFCLFRTVIKYKRELSEIDQ